MKYPFGADKFFRLSLSKLKIKHLINTAMYQYPQFDYVSDPGCNFISYQCGSGSAISYSCIFNFEKILNAS